jgi:hypothetical protein
VCERGVVSEGVREWGRLMGIVLISLLLFLMSFARYFSYSGGVLVFLRPGVCSGVCSGVQF